MRTPSMETTVNTLFPHVGHVVCIPVTGNDGSQNHRDEGELHMDTVGGKLRDLTQTS